MGRLHEDEWAAVESMQSQEKSSIALRGLPVRGGGGRIGRLTELRRTRLTGMHKQCHDDWNEARPGLADKQIE